MARRLIAAGTRVAVPVIVEKNAPVAFREWTPGCRMEKGFWDIPVPADTDTLNPGALVVPLVGFDEAGYRLGHGGGYYDRTLAALNPRPVAIGLGLELGRLPSIEPLPHDIPMHAIVTEAGAWRYERPAAAIADEDDVEAASPTCLLSEVGFGSEVPWR
jgi:5-formyltetrahydrofolate cyclo-ligase